MEKRAITKEIMKIDTGRQTIDMQQINNRRFMYNPKTGVLVLGYQYEVTSLKNSSHAGEMADAGITEGYDDFVRGWIGVGGDYPKGVIHFAPCADEKYINLFNQAFDTLEMFKKNGALADTVVRGFGRFWEQRMSDIFPDMRDRERKASVRKQLKKQPETKAVRQKTNHQQER